jgi:hypothetical protein
VGFPSFPVTAEKQNKTKETTPRKLKQTMAIQR